MKQIYNAVYPSPIGELGILCQGDSLATIDWLDDLTQDFSLEKNTYASVCLHALDGYFEHRKKRHNLPELLKQGTEFQQLVWSRLLQIPYGEAYSYGDLATQLNTSSRAIGQACRTNRIPILIPCHRIIAKGGIGGFMGKQQRTDRKRWLLNHEGFEFH